MTVFALDHGYDVVDLGTYIIVGPGDESGRVLARKMAANEARLLLVGSDEPTLRGVMPRSPEDRISYCLADPGKENYADRVLEASKRLEERPDGLIIYAGGLRGGRDRHGGFEKIPLRMFRLVRSLAPILEPRSGIVLVVPPNLKNEIARNEGADTMTPTLATLTSALALGYHPNLRVNALLPNLRGPDGVGWDAEEAADAACCLTLTSVHTGSLLTPRDGHLFPAA